MICAFFPLLVVIRASKTADISSPGRGTGDRGLYLSFLIFLTFFVGVVCLSWKFKGGGQFGSSWDWDDRCEKSSSKGWQQQE